MKQRTFNFLKLSIFATIVYVPSSFSNDLGFRPNYNFREYISSKGGETKSFDSGVCNITETYLERDLYGKYYYNSVSFSVCQARWLSCRDQIDVSKWGYNTSGLLTCSKGLESGLSGISGWQYSPGVILRDSNLSNVEMLYSNFNEAFMDGSNLSDSNFYASSFANASFSRVNAKNSHFEGSYFDVTAGYSVPARNPRDGSRYYIRHFGGANFQGAKFNEASVRLIFAAGNLSYTDFYRVGTRYKGSYYLMVTDSTMVGASVMEAVIPGSRFLGVDMRSFIAERADMSRSTFRGTNLQNSRFSGVNLRGSYWLSDYNYQTILDGSDLSNANIGASHIGSRIFGGMMLARNVNFRNANFELSRIESVDFSGSNFILANLTTVSLCNVNLKTAINLEQADLRGTRYDKTTTLPFSAAIAQRKGMTLDSNACGG